MIYNMTGGSIIYASTQAIVNPVNCVGVMGRGLARQFRDYFPTESATYVAACRQGLLEPGKILPVRMSDGRWIIHLPTKNDWRDKSSSLVSVTESVIATAMWCRDEKIKNISIPAVGCGNGGLSWETVQRMITRSFHEYPKIDVYLYAPIPGGEK